MSLSKSDCETHQNTTAASGLFLDFVADQTNCGCCHLLPEIKERVVEIVSTLKQEREQLLESSVRQLDSLREEKARVELEKDEIIEDLKCEIFKLIAVKNELKRGFDDVLQKKNQEINELRSYLQKRDRRIESYKLLSPRTKDPSIHKRVAQQFQSPKHLERLDSEGKFSMIPTTPSMTSLSRKSSAQRPPPLKRLIDPKYLLRSKNIKSTLNLISRVKTGYFRSQVC